MFERLNTAFSKQIIGKMLTPTLSFKHNFVLPALRHV